jgi:hypothetical protein
MKIRFATIHNSLKIYVYCVKRWVAPVGKINDRRGEISRLGRNIAPERRVSSGMNHSCDLEK